MRVSNIRHAQCNMTRHSKRSLIRVCPNVQHLFDPVRAVGDLHHDPVVLTLGATAMPIPVKSENISVKSIRPRNMFHNDAGVDDTQVLRVQILRIGLTGLDERDAVVLRIA